MDSNLSLGRLSARAAAALAALCFAAGAAPAWSQTHYPQRPVRMVVPFAPGGASDFVGRILQAKLSEVLGVATLTYRPLGFDSSAMPFAPPIRSACEKVLVCPDAVKNGLASPGQQPAAAPTAAPTTAPAPVPASPTTTPKR